MSIASESVLTLDLIRDAHARIKDKIHRTPVVTSALLDAQSNGSLFFKSEQLQKTGAFKARGATNAVFSLCERDASRGVVTHSSGNHGAAVAQAASLRQIPAYIVMPRDSPRFKQEAVRRYGGQIVFSERDTTSRESVAKEVAAATGASLVHSSNDLRVMAGQGTILLELLEDAPGLDAVICPVGGGGQLGGIAVAAKSLAPHIKVIGVEPEGADDAVRSFRADQIVVSSQATSIADGLLVSLGSLPFVHIRRYVDDIIPVSEASIVNAMRTIWEVLKAVVEPSGAVAYAAVHGGRVSVAGMRVGIILSGGNLDLSHLPWQ